MKKWFSLLVVLVPSLSHADSHSVSAGNVTVNITANNVQGAQAGSWINGLQVSTINCNSGITCSDSGNGILSLTVSASGGGGGGGGVAISSEAHPFVVPVSSIVFVGISSIDFNGSMATVTIRIPQGVIMASHTGVNFWTSTRALASNFSAFGSSQDTLISLAISSITNLAARIDFSTGAIKLEVAASTLSLASVFSSFLSTTANRSEWNASKSTADILIQNIALSTGTLASNFSAFGSSQDTKIAAVISSVTSVASRLDSSTSQARIDIAASTNALRAEIGSSTSGVINPNVGSFTNSNITVNAQGQITAAANGTAGGGGGGSSSLAVGTGSFVDATFFSSPTAGINFSSGTFTGLLKDATAFINLRFDSVTAQGFIDTTTFKQEWVNSKSTADIRIQNNSLSTGTLATGVAASTNAYSLIVALSTGQNRTDIAASTNATRTEVASSTNAIRTEIATSTNALASFFSISQGTVANRVEWNASKSTNDILTQNQALSTGTLASNFSTFMTTMANRVEWNLSKSTNDTDHQVFNTTMTAVRKDTSTLAGTVSNLTTVGYDEGSALTGGMLSTLNCVGAGIACTQSGSTLTMTVSGAAGGGGGGGSGFSGYTGSAMQFNSSASFVFNGAITNINNSGGNNVAVATYTIGTSTLPFIRLSIPSQALRARSTRFGAGDYGSNVSISTNITGTNVDDGKFLSLDYFAFAPSTQQFAQFQWTPSSGGWNGMLSNSTMSWDYSGFVSSGSGAGKQVNMTLRATCLGANANLQTTAWGTSVPIVMTQITSNFIMRASTRSAAITPAGTCFGGSPILFQVYRQPLDGNDNMSGATGQYFNLTELGIYYRKSPFSQDEIFAQ